MDWETYVQVRHNQLITFDRPMGGFRQPEWRKPPKRRGYSGEVTASTKKRIETAVDIFLQMSPERRVFNPVIKKETNFQLSFITLTISHPEEIPASEGHKALKSWLQHFKKPWHKRKMSEPMTSYIWKAEKQARGQLHYHLTTNSWLHLAEIRRVWNDIQKNRGWLESYKTAKGHYDPNSTDVHSIHRIKNLKAYLTKYISKQEYTESPANVEAGFPSLLVPVTLDAKVWGCSKDIEGKKRFTEVMDKWTYLSMQAGLENEHLKLKETKHCKFYSLKDPKFKTEDYLSVNHLNMYTQWKK